MRSDALPFLRDAASVRVLTVTDGNTETIQRSGADLIDHLKEHGVRASFEMVNGSGSSTGKVIGTWAQAHEIDALGRRDQNGHRPATVLGYDLALAGSVIDPSSCRIPARSDDCSHVDLPPEKSALAQIGRACRRERWARVRRAVLENIANAGFKRQFALVNPRYAEIGGIAAVNRLDKLPLFPSWS